MVENFVCPICGCMEYLECGTTVHPSLGVQLYKCKGCTTTFVDPEKFAAAAQRPENLARIFFESASAGLQGLMGALKEVRATKEVAILSQDEIDTLLAATGSSGVARGEGLSAMRSVDPLEVMVELLEPEILAVVTKLREIRAQGHDLAPHQEKFVEMYGARVTE